MRILLIEDDPGLGNAVCDQIAAEGHVPDLAQPGLCAGSVRHHVL